MNAAAHKFAMQRLCHFAPYALDNGDDQHGNCRGFRGAPYAVQIGGVGGRIIGRSLNLNFAEAQELCAILEDAFEMGAESMVGA